MALPSEASVQCSVLQYHVCISLGSCEIQFPAYSPSPLSGLVRSDVSVNCVCSGPALPSSSSVTSSKPCAASGSTSVRLLDSLLSFKQFPSSVVLRLPSAGPCLRMVLRFRLWRDWLPCSVRLRCHWLRDLCASALSCRFARRGWKLLM